MKKLSAHSPSFRPDLQGLRALAVLLVILTHSGLGIISGGFIGVDVFFVLSGYLITSLLVDELKQTGNLVFLQFYARRFKRLLPGLAVMLCVMSIATVCLLSGFEARKLLSSGAYAAMWVSNLYFAFNTLDYFDELASRDLFLHTWSLGVEEQFYLVWPIALYTLVMLQAWKHGKGANNTRLLYPGVGCLCLASLLLSLYWSQVLPQSAFYLMPARIWQLALGAIVFLASCGYVNIHYPEFTHEQTDISWRYYSDCG